MTKHKTGTRQQWLAARLELLKAEKELTRRSDELARRRQELPWVRIDKEYRFETDGGSASLADFFAGARSSSSSTSASGSPRSNSARASSIISTANRSCSGAQARRVAARGRRPSSRPCAEST